MLCALHKFAQNAISELYEVSAAALKVLSGVSHVNVCEEEFARDLFPKSLKHVSSLLNQRPFVP